MGIIVIKKVETVHAPSLQSFESRKITSLRSASCSLRISVGQTAGSWRSEDLLATLCQLVFEVNDLLAVVVGALQRIKIFKQLAHLRDAFLSASLDVEWK